ncbi:hypothetical protein GCM10027605_40590 [Micromonospora zhanjiangensis]
MGVDRVVARDSLGRVLVAAASRALRGEDCADLGRRPLLARFPGAPEVVRRVALRRATARAAVPGAQVGVLDADRVARWVVDQYPARCYPGVVLGSPHGAAVHLAAALGVPWLPAGFEVTVDWPGGAADDPLAAMAYGSRVVAPLLAADPGVRVRQVHDPAARGALCGSTVALTVRWRRLPDAYRRFLGTRIVPGAPVLLLRDARTWPVLDPGRGTASRSADRPAGSTRVTSCRTARRSAGCSGPPGPTSAAGTRRAPTRRTATASTPWSRTWRPACGTGPGAWAARCTGCCTRGRRR